jgi:glycosyltransferase involved in cell wall biosynthesis
MRTIRYKFLFNFARSYSGGGYKRLHAFARWFNANGGAWFIIHPSCQHLTQEFPVNQFRVAAGSRFSRLYNDCGYLRGIVTEMGQPELYYSNGIPLYGRVGRMNWFNLSNLLHLEPNSVPLSFQQRLKGSFLGMRIRSGLRYADVISGESACSLQMLKVERSDRLMLSVMGSDDELDYLGHQPSVAPDAIATVVGTIGYKNLEYSLLVFQELRSRHPELKLIVIGDPAWVPKALLHRDAVIIKGYLPRGDVMEHLRRSRYYISTTRIEGSYNAAAEGAFLAEESYISDIAPHRELLRNESFSEVAVPGVPIGLLQVRRRELLGLNLRRWDTIIREMIARAGVTL